MNRTSFFGAVLLVLLSLAAVTGAGAAEVTGKQKPGKSASSHRFVDNGNGTVTDQLTGLIWLKNADCFGLRNWEDSISLASGLADGQCGLTDGSRTGQWRLPDSDELSILINNQQRDSSDWLNAQSFSKVQSDLYWTSTASEFSSNIAMCADMHRGGIFKSGTAFSYHVWPVRGGK